MQKDRVKKMDSRLISVIIPVYNVEEYLEKCILSVISQTYENLEIILINDGSTDKSGEICDKYAKQYQNITVYHKSNGGLSSARNYGILHSSGEYIGFVDSDDFICATMFESLYKLCLEYDSDISICDFSRSSDINERKVSEEFNVNVYETKDIFNRILSDEISSHVWNKLFKRYLFNNIQFPVGKTYEDLYIFHELAFKSKKISMTNEKLYVYNDIRPTSIVHTRQMYNLWCISEAYRNRVYFADKYNVILEKPLKNAVMMSTNCYRISKKTSGYKEWLKEIQRFIKIYIFRIVKSNQIDLIRKLYCIIIYLKIY